MTGANRADCGRTWLSRRWMPWRYHGVTILSCCAPRRKA